MDFVNSTRRRNALATWRLSVGAVVGGHNWNARAELRDDLVIQDNGVVQQSRGNTGSLVWAGLCSRLPVDSVGSRDSYTRTADPGVRGVLHHCRFVDSTCRVGFAVPAKSEARRRLGGNRRLVFLPPPSC